MKGDKSTMKCYKCGKECNTNHFMVITKNVEDNYTNKYCCSLKCCLDLSNSRDLVKEEDNKAIEQENLI